MDDSHPPYSARRTWVGSARLARSAGSHEASAAVPSTSAGTTTKVTGSIGATPYRSDRMTPVARAAPPTPSTTPIAVSVTPCRTTSHCTWSARAPRAMRIPISRMRRRASCAVTP